MNKIPWIAAWNRELPAHFGHAFSLRCMFGPQPKYDYIWYKNGKLIPEHRSVLHFNISKHHIGVYKCKAPLSDHLSKSFALSCSMGKMVDNVSLSNDTYHVRGCPSNGINTSATVMIYIVSWLYGSAFML